MITKKQTPIAPLLCLGLVLAPVVSHSASRSCTAREEIAADRQLMEIQANEAIQNQLLGYHLPFGVHRGHRTGTNEHILIQGGYIMAHDGDLRTTLWTATRLTRKDIDNAAGKDRVNCFRRDPRLTEADGATPEDYKEPVFDQGHMTPDADLKDEPLEQINSYVMTNMSPQYCRFNRGVWLSLESLTRNWAEQYEDIHVTSGAIFDRDGDGRRDADDQAGRMTSNSGEERVAVPSHYFKTILRRDDKQIRSISFLLPHTNKEHGRKWSDVRPYTASTVVTMEMIEQMAGIFLHPGLARQEVNQSLDGKEWDMEKNQTNMEGTCR